MTHEIKINDKIKWKTKNLGFATGVVLDIVEGKLKVRKSSYKDIASSKQYTANAYTVSPGAVREVNGVEYEQPTDQD